ncbi:hypothetical protein A7U60_g4374 [Sanghuangporus baumii]|uniref:Uncharacterized protein n=1 Tax=Sanghuangporus baumii TaxID=108892 RepID=A0A9Q5HYP6_SANBA|nr:hypothetical protein A7U60_g4374 [Sanghuangporus baumii]
MSNLASHGNPRILLDIEAFLLRAKFTGVNGAKYVIQFLDALAFVLISKPTAEVIAHADSAEAPTLYFFEWVGSHRS